ncbi:MAG: protein kinase [Alphaproteobacteria bacterium]|nr:protein kinase [Alphaproteobacteria bacterium]
MDLQTGTVVDRYTVQSVLGEGGMAVVYLCRHNQLGTMHALKVLTMSSRAIRERLVQEGRVQAQLRHRNIVAVTDIIMLNGAPGLVMEYIEGPSLDELIEQKPLSYEQADALAEGVLDGVAHAHAMGLVHRDLKPANIMLSLEGSMLVPKVTDFGLAKLLEGDTGRAATRTGSTMGTPHYMSPEQVSDSKNVDHRTDVFALGAILYELVTGRRAFGGENLLQIFSAVASSRFTPPRELKPDIPTRMEKAILGALEPDRDKRIQTVDELRAVWTGKVTHAGGAEPTGPSGPFSAEFLSSVSKSPSSSAGTQPGGPGSVPSADTWAGQSHISVDEAPISVESLFQGPPLEPPPPKPRKSDAPTNEVPADSLVSGTSLVVGGGAAFVMAAVIGGVGLALIGVLGLGAWLMSGEQRSTVVPVAAPVPIHEPEVPEPDAPEPVEPDPVRPDPAPTSGPRPSPGPRPTEPRPVTPDPVPEPVAPDPVEPEPVQPEPEPSGDAVAVATDAPVGDAAAAALDPNLVDPSPAKRESAVSALVDNPNATAVLIGIARNDPESDVRIRAWQVLLQRYERKLGDQAAQEAFVLEALKSGRFSKREAAIAYGNVGSDVQKLVPLLRNGDILEVKAAANAIARIGIRVDKRDEARAVLEAELANAGFVNKKWIKGALDSL